MPSILFLLLFMYISISIKYHCVYYIFLWKDISKSFIGHMYKVATMRSYPVFQRGWFDSHVYQLYDTCLFSISHTPCYCKCLKTDYHIDKIPCCAFCYHGVFENVKPLPMFLLWWTAQFLLTRLFSCSLI